MHRRKLLILLVLVVALAALARFVGSDGDQDPAALSGEVALAPGLDPGRVFGIRVENAERQSQIRLERDEQNLWWLVEPLRWRADAGVVRSLLDAAGSGRAVPAEGVSPEDASLLPPRFSLEFLERRADGSERRHRIAYGAMDIGSQRVFALLDLDGRPTVVRASRAPVALLELPVSEYRERRLVDAMWSEVTAFERRGGAPLPADADTEQDALSGGALGALHVAAESELSGWFASAPVRVRLDPQALGLLLRAATQVRARGFHDDSPLEVRSLGLDPPLFTFAYEMRAKERFGLSVGSPPEEAELPFDDRRWFARQEGRPNVIRLDPMDVRLLASPLSYLVDHQLVRMERARVRSVRIQWQGRVIECQQEQGLWMVQREGQWRPADSAGINDLLTALERVELVGFPWLGGAFQTRAADGSPGPEIPPPGGDLVGRLELSIDAQDGGSEWVLGGEFAAPLELAGVRGHPFRRFGEHTFGLLAEEDAKLLLPAEETLLSPTLLSVAELDLVEVHVRGLGRERTWLRDANTGRWQAAGAGVEDKRFALVVDHLLHVRARVHLDAAAQAAQEEPIAVRLRLADGSERGYDLGRRPGGQEVLARVDSFAAEVAPAAYERLRELLDVR